MQRFRLLSIALMAIFTLGAIASATASAEEIGILPGTAKFSGESTKEFRQILVTTKGSRIECSKLSYKGEMKTDLEGTVTIGLEGCKSGAPSCNTAGDAKGVLLFPAVILAVVIGLNVKMESALEPAMVLKLKETLTIVCGELLKIEVKGGVIGALYKNLTGTELLKTNTKFKEAFLVFSEKEKGEQLFTTCELDKQNCEGASYKLEINFGAGFELSAETSDSVIKFEPEAEFHF